MPLKGILFISLFAFCAVGALFAPHLGVYGYVADYGIGTSDQWWAAQFKSVGLRFSLTLALTTVMGLFINRTKLRHGQRVLQTQELLVLLFLVFVWFSVLLGEETAGAKFSKVDHPSVKFTKIVIFCMLMTHAVTDIKKLKGLQWCMILVALVLGLQAWDLPRSKFQAGRLEGIGGADFAEANFFAAYMAAMLPIIGIRLLKTNWIGKGVCVLSAAFTANAVVLCRSRGAFLGIVVGGVAACVTCPKKYRKIIALLMLLGVAGGAYVVDPQFIERIQTLTAEKEDIDESAFSRVRLVKAGIEMLSDHPLGIGIGNWYQTIGRYIPDYAGKDAHNTYVKCAAEIGIQGAGTFSLILATMFLGLWRVRKLAQSIPDEAGEELVLLSFAFGVSLVVMLTSGLTISMIYAEFLWIFLMLPVCLVRSAENALEDFEKEGDKEEGGEDATEQKQSLQDGI